MKLDTINFSLRKSFRADSIFDIIVLLKITIYVDESEVDDINELFHYVQETLNLNGFDSFDEYGAPCNFQPQYEYTQTNFYEFNDNSEFAVDYDLTSNSNLTDMCLQMAFLYTDNGLKSVFITVDPQ